MKESRTISKDVVLDGATIPVATVARTRTSDGLCSIGIAFDGGSFLITNDENDFGDQYEQLALDLAKAIADIANNPCKLSS